MRRKVTSAIVTGVLVLGAVGLALERGPEHRQPAVDPHGTTLPAQRQVQLSRVMPAPSDHDGLHAKLIRGTMPTAAVEATVLTDEQCQPDARGISHCLNRIRLADDTEIQVRHPHDMSRVACLAPGEHVRLVPTPVT